MKINKSKLVLILLFLFVFGLRLFFSFSTPTFASDESYLTLYNVDEVLEGNLYSSYDELSYGGRVLLYHPLFYIVFAFLTFGSVFLIKVLTALLFSSLVFIIYLMATSLTASRWYGVFGAAIACLSPYFLIKTVNTPTPYALALPLFFLMFYALIKLRIKKIMWLFVILSFVLPFVHPLGIVFILVVLVYFFLLGGGALTASKLKKEFVFLSFLSILFVSLLVYKKAFLENGLNTIWQNIPLVVLSDIYAGLNVIDLLLGVGLFGLILGLVGLYFGFVKDKDKVAYLYASIILTIVFLLYFGVFLLSLGIILLSISLGLMSSVAVKHIINYASKLKTSIPKNLLIFLFSVVVPVFVVVLAIFALVSQDVVSVQQERDLLHLEKAEGKVVLGNLQEGHLITALANKANVADTNFLMAPSPEDRIEAITVVYKTPSAAIAKSLLKEYKVDIIYLSDKTKELFNITSLKYVREDRGCFEQDGNFIYFKCK